MEIRYGCPPARTRSFVKLIQLVITRLLVGNERSEHFFFSFFLSLRSFPHQTATNLSGEILLFLDLKAIRFYRFRETKEAAKEDTFHL